MPRVYVSIGSNIEREKNLRRAMQALKEQFGVVAASAVYESQAEGFDGDDFYNLVAAFDTDRSLERLRETLGAIEAAQGRERTSERFAPRTLDIDILLYGDVIRHEGGFHIPRRDIAEYAYVLRPLAELAPQVRHPETGERLVDLWQRRGDERRLRKVPLHLE
jgi:2-amino-4-hydroxy-6-hydroxymethyldihydropteridine diphosphokinase